MCVSVGRVRGKKLEKQRVKMCVGGGGGGWGVMAETCEDEEEMAF